MADSDVELATSPAHAARGPAAALMSSPAAEQDLSRFLHVHSTHPPGCLAGRKPDITCYKACLSAAGHGHFHPRP